ncbi:MAG: class IV adenylate cyclase [Candidatus Paceibacterota bacterium]|jgi:adenylate cyclase class 2
MKSEIEVKAKVSNFNELISKLKEIGCVLSEPIIQDDYIYIPKGVVYEDIHNHAVLRLRKQGDRNLFTLKKNRSNELDCIEREIDVNNGEILIDIFELMGYVPFAEVHKKRRKTQYNEYEICVDEVNELGSFIEVEKMSDEADGEKVQGEIFDFMQTLGVKREDRVMNGYDTLVWMKNNKKN